MLPGRRGRPHATHKISIGEFVKDHPDKDSKFTIRRFDKQSRHWVVNEELQARLVATLEELGAPNPQEPSWVPVITPYQTPEEAVFSELAMWAAGRYVCHCSRFVLKTPATRVSSTTWGPPNAATGGSGETGRG